MRKNTPAKRRTGRITVHALLALGGIVMVFPFYVMLRSAFTPEKYILDGSLDLAHFTLENFDHAWSNASWQNLYLSSVVTTSVIFLLQVITSVPAGYALARLKFRGRNVTFWVVMACFIVPTQVVAIPLYIMLSKGGFGDSLTGLIAPFISSAFGIYLMRQFVLSIPQSLFDAARLDHVGPIAVVWRVVLPNVKPAIVALGVFSITAHWNDLFWPSVILRTSDHATVPYGITQFAATESGTNYGAQMAAATLAVLPMLVAYIIFQRHFVRGISFARGND